MKILGLARSHPNHQDSRQDVSERSVNVKALKESACFISVPNQNCVSPQPKAPHCTVSAISAMTPAVGCRLDAQAGATTFLGVGPCGTSG